MQIENVSSRVEVLKFIASSSIYGNLGLFIGTGLSMAILNDEEKEIALPWGQLINECANKLSIKIDSLRIEGQSYPELASAIVKEISIKNKITYPEAVKIVKDKIRELTGWFPNKEKREQFGKYIYDLNPNWIITTNYDLILECLLTGKSISLSPDDQLIAPAGIIPIYHLHGIRTNPASIVITQEDYISLFRPSQYRHTKLTLTIKESTTLVLGYSLGDVNVLTSVDWSKHVYKHTNVNYPHEIIQVIRKEKPKAKPYRDKNDIVIVEISELVDFFEELQKVLKREKKVEEGHREELFKINKILEDPSEEQINKFINDADYRDSVLSLLSKFDTYVVSGFLELYSKCIDKTWDLAMVRNAFNAYNMNLNMNLDILIKLNLRNIPPALLETVVYNLNQMAHYIGRNPGQSYAAYKTWQSQKKNISKETVDELKSIAGVHQYAMLLGLLEGL